MKRQTDFDDPEDMPAEFDFSALGPPQRRGYAERMEKSTSLRILEADLAEQFKDSSAVNEALREYLVLTRKGA